MLYVDINVLISFIINLGMTRKNRGLEKTTYIFQFSIKDLIGSDIFNLDKTKSVFLFRQSKL